MPTLLDAEGGRIFASPLARRLATEAGLALEELVGTGPNGRIRRRDVEAAAAGLGPSPTTGEAEHGQAAPSSERVATTSGTAPHLCLRETVRVDDLLAVRAQLNELASSKVSVNDLLIKAASQAHVRTPAMNVIRTPGALRSFSGVDVSVSVATDHGLVAPVLRGVEQMPVSRVSSTVADLVERARCGRLHEGELEGGTLTVSNLGMFGVEEFAAITDPPRSAILAVGAARQAPVVHDGALIVGTTMRVALAVDHRAIDGVVAAEWMHSFKSLLERPLSILA
jgi:pyruvate dehydrogenase E2 component (dihydrolipoamide acetyltransferase)